MCGPTRRQGGHGGGAGRGPAFRAAQRPGAAGIRRPAARHAGRRGTVPVRAAAGCAGPDRRCETAGRRLLHRHAQEGRARLRPDPQPTGAVPGRAPRGRGPGLRRRDPPASEPHRRLRHHRRGPGRQDPAAGVYRPGRLEGRRRGGIVMARLLVQLKLRLVTNALRSSTGAKVSFMTSTVFAVLLAIATFVILATLRGQTEAVAQTATIFTVFAFGWLILPLFSFGLDGTLDPATLALYPLRTRPLAVGLLAASATGAWPLANVVGLLGVTIGLAHGVLGELAAVLAVLLQVLFCITLARFVTTAMAGLLRSRRGRDLAVLLIIPIFALYEAFSQTVPRMAAEGKITAASFTGLDA